MQAKGFIKFVSVLCFLASVWILSFTFVTRNVEKKARIEATDANGIVDEVKEAEILREKRSKKIWLGYTYKECKDKELGLGLDLKGGMNVMLEVSLPDIVKALSDGSTDTTFTKAISLATQNMKSSTKDFITLFGEAWEKIEPDARLSRVFATYNLREKIKTETPNSEVITFLREESNASIENSFNVLRSRIDRFGVASPNVQRIGNSGRIMVELPGVKEPDRVRKLLQGTANLEFWETFENSEIINILVEADKIIQEIEKAKLPEGGIVQDSIVQDSVVQSTVVISDSLKLASDSTTLSSLADLDKATDSLNLTTSLFTKLSPALSSEGQALPGPVIGYVSANDTALINQWLSIPKVRALFPREFTPMWSVKAIDEAETFYSLIAIKVTSRDGTAPLDGGAIVDARRTSDQRSGFGVSMSMNPEGSKKWARITHDNINRSIAIVLDGYVYSFPTVNGEITGGTSSITGDFSSNDADDLANVLKSGKMPAPVKIVQEAVVGPSLGSESINAGIMSVIVAFLIILLYMWFYYGQAGTTANVALVANVLLLFGAMASFGAILTLPGIAGIVLTMGMAIDANVIIYERIKEEIKAGNGLRESISRGYSNAMSAIIDGQLTTLAVGIILYILGTGPVKGFATTLVVGIITSLVTSIFMSRLVFEWMLKKEINISFGNKWTLNLLDNTHIDFLGKRKFTYVLSSVVIILGLISIFTKGMSYGIDFTGGRTYVVKFDQPIRTDEIRNKVMEFDPSGEVKQFGPNTQLKITTKYKIDDTSDNVDKEVTALLYAAIKDAFAKELSYEEFTSTDRNPNGIISSETVGPTIAHDLKTKAFMAAFVALLFTFIYIAIRFSNWEFGLGGVVSLFHDALITVAAFSFFAGILPWTMDVDQSFIAAILTVIAYSINDCIVIFDRVRENRKLYPKQTWHQLINSSVNSTLMRTFNTSMSTLLVLFAIFIFGGEVIRGFSFAIIIGVAVGVYSTMFIAIPIAYDLLARKEKKLADKLVKSK